MSDLKKSPFPWYALVTSIGASSFLWIKGTTAYVAAAIAMVLFVGMFLAGRRMIMKKPLTDVQKEELRKAMLTMGYDMDEKKRRAAEKKERLFCFNRFDFNFSRSWREYSGQRVGFDRQV